MYLKKGMVLLLSLLCLEVGTYIWHIYLTVAFSVMLALLRIAYIYDAINQAKNFFLKRHAYKEYCN